MNSYQRNALGHAIRCTRAQNGHVEGDMSWIKTVMKSSEEDRELDARCGEAVVRQLVRVTMTTELITEIAAEMLESKELPTTLFGLLGCSRLIDEVVEGFFKRGYLFVEPNGEVPS